MASHVEQQPVGAGASGGVISGVYGGMSQRRPGELYFPCPADRLRRLRQALLYQSAFQEILQRRLRQAGILAAQAGAAAGKAEGYRVQDLRRRFHAQTRRRCLLLQRLSPKGIPAEHCGQW